MIESFVPNASTYGHEVDNLFSLITWVMGFWFLLGEGIFIYFIFKFRRKEGVKTIYLSGEKKEEKKHIKVAHFSLLACDVVLVIFAVLAWYHIKQELPAPDRTVKVISQQWAWTFVDPGKDNKLDTADDITTIDELHVEVGKNYHYLLTSKDVLHSFFIPVFRLKQDALPGREITGWFNATKTGTYDITCAEICGVGHGLMGGRIFIESSEDYRKWAEAHSL
ncbi:MAG: cytochrome c oxidase subunit II [Deltaproteobacteria bacterium]|nr:cytochrome c oxidase subunit II [Deltaproteobacteria bacterium]